MMKAGKVLFAMALCVLGLAVLLGTAPRTLAAEPITINVVAAWPKATLQVDFFIKDFMERGQAEADKKIPGQLKLVFKGGPEIVATNEQITAIGKGMFDLLYTSATYYLSKMPELDVWNVTTLKPWEEKAVGLYDYVDKLHNEKTNTHFLARNGTGLPFQFGLTKPVKTLDDFKGMTVRVNPTTVQLVKALGGNPVQMPPSDLYTALERGLVQAHIIPAYMMRSFGVEKVTKYLLFPGFYDGNNDIIVNLDKWKKLPTQIQDFLTELADSHARNMFAFDLELSKKELADYKAGGMQFIDLPKADGEKMVKLANDFVTQIAMEKAPVETKTILEYLAKKP